MKIALIGPGIMTIPPPGWGAVEILIWDYALVLRGMGHEVDILNELRMNPADQTGLHMPYCQRLVEKVNSGDYDFVHVHYDCLFHLLPYFICPKIGITSHYPYIDQPEKHRGDGYESIFHGICQNRNHIIFALSRKDYSMFEKYCFNKKNMFLAFNGANSSEITPVSNPMYGNRSIYLGKIESRKKQVVYSTIPGIDYYGKCEDNAFQKLSCYKGEIEGHQKMMDILSQYGNFVLLSDGENGTPLVIKEALMAGLPVVTNKYSSDDLDVSLPFIDIIPNDKLQDLKYIQWAIEDNKTKQTMKAAIRQYAEDNFSWNVLVRKYIDFIGSV
jgi:glycosyltransferase involved in cell wall biosynthesis